MAAEYDKFHENCDNYEKYNSLSNIKLENVTSQAEDIVDSKAGMPLISDDNVAQGVLLDNIKVENLDEQLNANVGSIENCEFGLEEVETLKVEICSKKYENVPILQQANTFTKTAIEHDEMRGHYGNSCKQYNSDTDIKLEEFVVQTGDFQDSKAGISLVSNDNLAKNENVSTLPQDPLLGDNEAHVELKLRKGSSLKETSIRISRRKCNSDVTFCKECNRTFTSSYYLYIHTHIHAGNTPYKCDICQKSFVTPYLLKKHKVSHSESRPYSCKICGKSFTNRWYCISHQVVHSNDRPFPCEQCDKTFKNRKGLNNHKISHKTEIVSCAQCGKSFEGKLKLYLHIRSVHWVKKVNTCSYCGRTYNNKVGLTRHIRKHTGEKPFTCEICKKSFSQMSVLKSHFKIHTGENLFTCKICKKSFCERSGLTGHMRKHTGERPFACKICKMSFGWFSGLKKHLGVHTGDCPYSCEVCAAKFKSPRNLTMHMKLHT